MLTGSPLLAASLPTRSAEIIRHMPGPSKMSSTRKLCPFHVLAMDGDDFRDLPLSTRKANLARQGGFEPSNLLNMIFLA